MNNIYKPTYNIRRVDYGRVLEGDGIEVEYSGFYMADEHIFDNPPDHKKTIEKLKQVLKGTGISKITVTFLDKNLWTTTGGIMKQNIEQLKKIEVNRDTYWLDCKTGGEMDRLIWFINSLSPHNLWKAREAMEDYITKTTPHLISSDGIKREAERQGARKFATWYASKAPKHRQKFILESVDILFDTLTRSKEGGE